MTATVFFCSFIKTIDKFLQKIRGVRHFFSAKDIPGKNNFSARIETTIEDEEIFVGKDSEIRFNGQPAGLILADTFDLANSAASKVKIIYVESGKLCHLTPTKKKSFKVFC